MNNEDDIFLGVPNECRNKCFSNVIEGIKCRIDAIQNNIRLVLTTEHNIVPYEWYAEISSLNTVLKNLENIK